jgi:DNA-binding XRE family transcriptional regulator
VKKIIKENTVSLEAMFAHFTPAQEENVDNEIRRYDMLVQLRDLRKQLGLTQIQLAQKAAMPRTTITKIESGSYNPTISTLLSIASAMDKKLQVRFV